MRMVEHKKGENGKRNDQKVAEQQSNVSRMEFFLNTNVQCVESSSFSIKIYHHECYDTKPIISTLEKKGKFS